MSDKTGISWADATWNPMSGCTRVSPGCEHCYIDWAPPFRIEGRHFVDAAGERSQAIGSTTGVRLHPDRLDQPLRWTRPRRIFVNSLSDLFHDEVPDAFIARVFAVMAMSRRHTFQILTKRPARMRSLLNSKDFWRLVGVSVVEDLDRVEEAVGLVRNPLPNVWLGVSVENQAAADLRIPHLLRSPAAVRFLSCEPLIGPVDLTAWVPEADCSCTRYVVDFSDPERFHDENLERNDDPACQFHHPSLDWVIVGGESGKDARPMHPDWARALRDECMEAGVALWFKQAGAVLAKEWGCRGAGARPD